MAAVIESLGDPLRGAAAHVTFTWADVLRLEAACCSALQQHQRRLQSPACDACAVTVLLLPRSALLLASVLACMRLQVRQACELQTQNLQIKTINP